MLQTIPERNRQMLQMREQGGRRVDVARKFNLSPNRISLIEKRDAADRLLEERRCRLREMLRLHDALEKLMPVEDLVDAMGVTVMAKKRLMEHFVTVAKKEISLRELMDMCLDVPVQGRDFMMPPLFRVRGVGIIGFWGVVNGLTKLDLGERCNEEWGRTLEMVKRNWRVIGPTPYSAR